MGSLDLILNTSFFYAVIRATTPILFAGLGAMLSRRSGIMNIGLEGIMLVSSLFGVLTSAWTQNIFLGVLGAVVAGIITSLIFAYFVLNMKADIILTGLAINILASGGTVFLLELITGSKGTSISLNSLVVPSIEIPILKDIPILGEIFSGHNLLTYVALLSVVAIHSLLYKTPFGLRVRSVGENPNAAESVGVNVNKTRYLALVIVGILGGLGGAYMSMGYVSWFARDMAGGRGFMALSAQNLGNGTPIGTMLASFIFGAADALSSTLQILDVPAEFIQMIPYLTTIIGMIIYAIIKRKNQNKKVRVEIS